MKIPFRQEVMNIQPYVPGKAIEEVQKEYGLTKIVKLASNENPLGPAQAARDAMSAAVESMHLYPDGHCTRLKDVLAQHLRITSDQLIVGNGSDEILKLIGEAFLQSGDQIVMADPSFSEYQYVARLMGSGERLVPVKDYCHDLAAMASAVNEKTKIVFICNPNNPTGTIVNEGDLLTFLQSVPRHVLVVIDEAYYEYVVSPDYPETIPLLAEYDNVIILRTFSKIYGLAGLRIGYGIGHPELISLVGRAKEPFNVNAMAQAAAVASLGDDNHIRHSRQVNEEGKKILYQEFAALNLPFVPTEANFILVDTKRDAQTMFQSLLRRGIIVRPAHIFGLPTSLRVTVGLPQEMQVFAHALREVLSGANCH